MRNMLAFLAAAVLTVIGVGWYFDWYRLNTVPGDSGHRSVTIDINTKKISHDLGEVEHKVEKKLAEKNQSATTDTTDSVKQGDPVKPIVGKALRKFGDVLDPSPK